MKQILTQPIIPAEELPNEEELEPGKINKIQGLLKADFEDENERENILQKIKSQSLDEIADFILVTLNEASNKDELPQWFVDGVMDRFFQEFEKNPVLESNEFLHDEYLIELIVEKLISYHGRDRINQPVNLTDRAFLSAVKYRIVHEESTEQYLKNLLEGGDLVRADILIDSMADLGSNLKLNGRSLFEFAQHYANNQKATDKGFEKLLDFENPDNYGQTVKIIDFLKKIHGKSDNLDEASPVIIAGHSDAKISQAGIKNILERKIGEDKGSYLLNLHTKNYLAEMQRWENFHRPKRKHVGDDFIDLAPGVWGHYLNGYLYIDKEENYANQNSQHIIRLSDLRLGEVDDIDYSHDDERFLADFVFMSRPEVRSIIIKDLGIDLSKIPLKEQANFLQLLISRKESEITELKDFISIHKDAGLRTFLSMEHGGREMGEKILEIGEVLKDQPEVAKQLFAKYATMVDGADNLVWKISNIYKEKFYNKQLDCNVVMAAVLKRANELLLVSGQRLIAPEIDEHTKAEVVSNLILDLSQESLIQSEMISEIDRILTEFNCIYEDALGQYRTVQHEEQKASILSRMTFDSDDDRDDYEDYLDMLKEIDENPDIVAPSLIESEIQTNEVIRDQTKFDSVRLKEMLVEMKTFASINSEHAIIVEAVIKKVENLIDIQYNLENKLDKIVRGEFHLQTDDKILNRYHEIKNSVYHISEFILENFPGRNINQEKISEQLLKEALAVISSPTHTTEEQKQVMIKLDQIKANILLLKQVLGQLSTDEKEKLDLKDIPIIEKLTDLPGSEMLKRHDLVKKIVPIIQKQFPKGDAGEFVKELKENHDLLFNATLIDGELISFYTKSKLSENVTYTDWFISNPDIKGLGGATLKSGYNQESDEQKAEYAVVKLHVKSAYIFVEMLDFVAFKGSTEDEEYKDHYVRIKKLPGSSFVSKNISPEKQDAVFKNIGYVCDEDNQMRSMLYNGKILNICRTEFHGQSALDDIKKDEPDGWLMSEIERQSKNGYVMTRLIPGKNIPQSQSNNQTFFAIFEKETPDPELEKELDEIIDKKIAAAQARISHSDSKKAVNN